MKHGPQGLRETVHAPAVRLWDGHRGAAGERESSPQNVGLLEDSMVLATGNT